MVSISEEIQKSKGVIPSGTRGIVSPSQESIRLPTPKGLAAIGDSIASSSGPKSYPSLLSFPELDPPNAAMGDLIRFLAKMEDSFSFDLEGVEEEVGQIDKEAQALNKKKLDALLKEAKAQKKKDSWESLGSLCEYLSASSTIALGVGYGATGIGALYFASGVLFLGAKTLKDTSLLSSISSRLFSSDESQEKFEKNISYGSLALSTLSAVGAGFLAYQKGAGFLAEKLPSGIQSALNFFPSISYFARSTSDVGSCLYEKRASDMQAFLVETKADLIEFDGLKQNIIAQTKQSQELLQQIGDLLAEITHNQDKI